MLGRLSIVIYWIGLLIGGGFFLLALYVALAIVGVISDGQPDSNSDDRDLWMTVAIFMSIGLFFWGPGWVIRYVVTGAKGISPMAKGRDDAVANVNGSVE